MIERCGQGEKVSTNKIRDTGLKAKYILAYFCLGVDIGSQEKSSRARTRIDCMSRCLLQGGHIYTVLAIKSAHSLISMLYA